MQPNPTQDPTRRYDALEIDAIYTLTMPDRYPPIMSLVDLGREIETSDPDAVVRPLVNAGLLHRTSDDHVFATLAAYRMVGLTGHVV
jgi:hypothetical protein